MPALRPIASGPLGVPEEDGVLAATSSRVAIFGSAAVLTTSISLVCATAVSVVATSASLTNAIRFACSTTVSLTATSAYLGTGNALASSSTIFFLSTYAALPQFGLGANAVVYLNSSPSVSLTTWPNLRAATVAPQFLASGADLTANIKLVASGSMLSFNDSFLPSLTTGILLGGSLVPTPGKGGDIVFQHTGVYANGLTYPELTCQTFLFANTILNRITVGIEGEANGTPDPPPSLTNQQYFTSVNNQITAISNNAILSTGIDLRATSLQPGPWFTSTFANLGTGAALRSVTNALSFTSNVNLQVVPAGVIPPDRSQSIRATAAKRLKIAGLGSGLATDYTDIKMTATG